MAIDKKKEKVEHPFQTVSKALAGGKVNSAVLFFGREQYLVNWATEQIITKYTNEATRDMDVSILEGDTTTIAEIKSTCETFAMFSEKRVVVIRELPLLEGKEDKKNKNFTKEQEEELRQFAESMPDHCILIFSCESVDKKTSIYKELNKKNAVYDFTELSEKDLKAFVVKRFKGAGKEIKLSILNELVSSSGYFNKEGEYTLYNLENDIKKIIAHSEGEEILISDVMSAVSGSLETNVFAMIEAISTGRKGEALTLFDSMLKRGEAFYKILAFLAFQFEFLLEVAEMKDEGNTAADIKKIMKAHEYRIKKAISFTSHNSTSKIRGMLSRIYEIDRTIKTGEMEGPLAMEIFITGI